jgi:hypothetical protein
VEDNTSSWPVFLWRVTACHLVSYFAAGIVAYNLFDYREFFSTGPLAALMRPVDSPEVALGPSLQVVRGLLFALVLWPFRRVILERDRGWLYLWGLFVGLAVLGTAGPTFGSFEGLIYTQLPLADHLRGLPEVVAQTLLFSLMLFYWHRRPRRIWNIAMGVAGGLIVLMSVAGATVGRG